MRARLMMLAALVTVCASLGAAACSVVGDGKVNKLNPPLGLEDTIATSTSEAPTTTEFATTTSGLTPTTAVQTEQVRLYFITNGQLTYVTQAIPSPAAPPLILFALQTGPQGELGFALRSAVPSPTKARIAVSTSAGVAQVELPLGFFDSIAVTDQRLAIGQIVLTLTDSRGVGQVQFNQAVPKPSGEITAAGQLLSKNDFQALLLDASNPPTTAPTAP